MQALRSVGVLVALLAVSACQGIPPGPTSPTLATSTVTSVPHVINLTLDGGALPIGGGSAIVFVEVLGSDGRGASGAVVALTTSTGTLDAEAVTTDGTGHARLGWRGTSSGTVTATLGSLSSALAITVTLPPVVHPPSVPPPPAPAPPPLPPLPPAPPQPPQLTVTLTASAAHAPVGAPVTFTAFVQNLHGETVLAYQWFFSSTTIPDATTVTENFTSHQYPSHGFKTARVTVTTSGGRSASASVQVVITN